MKRTGPDSLESWIIACLCSFLNMIIFGLLRLSGMLFVASVSRFQVSRDKASFPYTLAFVVRSSFGPAIGYLSHKFGVRFVTTLGYILAAVGAGACFFAENIDTVTVLWGVVFGFGAGMGTLLLPMSINQYFDKNRATASGFLFAGSSLGSFILAPIVEILLNNYGLSGTFLFLAGFTLNCVPAALLLKKPKFDINKISKKLQDQESILHGTKMKAFTLEDGSKNSLYNSKYIKNMNNATSSYEENEHNTAISYGENIKHLSSHKTLSKYAYRMSSSEPLNLNHILENWTEIRQVDLDIEKDKVFERSVLYSSVPYTKPKASNLLNEASSTNKHKTSLSEDANSFETNKFKRTTLTDNLNYRYRNSINDFNQKSIANLFSDSVTNDNERRKKSQSLNSISKHLTSYRINLYTYNFENPETFKNIPNYGYISKNKNSEKENLKLKHNELTPTPDKSISKSEKIPASETFVVMLDPMFILIIITYSIYALSFLSMVTVIVDFARDLHIGVSNEQYVLMALSMGSLIGRLGLGWITDSGFMTTTNFTAFCFAIQGVLIVAIVWSSGFVTLMILVTVYGLFESGVLLIIPVVIAQYIDPDKQTMAISSQYCIAGPVCLAVAPLIGYFRDNLGAYDWLLFGCGISLLFCCFLWLIVPCIIRCKRNK